jgi:hypothetical protein
VIFHTVNNTTCGWYTYPQIIERKKKNVFSYNERHLFDFDNANAINYNVGPIRMELDIYNKIIVVKQQGNA